MAFHEPVNLFFYEKNNSKVKLVARPEHNVIPYGHLKLALRVEEIVWNQQSKTQ